jgi:hypothetical protein
MTPAVAEGVAMIAGLSCGEGLAWARTPPTKGSIKERNIKNDE